MNPAAFSIQTDLPVDLVAWVARGFGGRDGGFPADWRTRPDLPTATDSRVAVLVHVFHVELLDEIVEQLQVLPVAFDLIVTNASGTSLTIDPARLSRLDHLVILPVENRGRDIWPMVQVVNAGLLDAYQLVLKVHTKRSEWRDAHRGLPGTGRNWRKDLLGALLDSPDNVIDVLESFATRPALGLVTADGSVLGPEFWGDNQAVTGALLRRLEIALREDNLQFAAGSMYWIRAFVLQGLRALNLSAADFEDEAGQVNATTAHALERLIGIVTRESGLAIRRRSDVRATVSPPHAWKRFDAGGSVRPRIRVVPFYLPQFHPIPENDAWWGRGFTEWTNVAAARPLFLAQHQPKLPTVTGFYDLRLPETVALQTSLAEAAGVSGFMYYHYWFAGRQLLDGPVRARVAGELPLSFCLMWANENWTRRWDGRDEDVLAGQHYDDVPSGRFIADVADILVDRRYLRVEGKAVVAIYRPAQIPDLAAVIDSWRASARELGIGELFVLNVDVAKEFHGVGDTAAVGLDGSLGFPPHNGRLEWLPYHHVGAHPQFAGSIFSYDALAADAIRKLERGIADDFFPGVMVAFDNTARRRRDPDVWFGSNPYTFRRWLAAAAAAVAHRDLDRRLVFVNAWNEWAEGAVLEPTDRFGATYLLAVRDVTHS